GLRARYGQLPADYVAFLGVHDGARPPGSSFVLAGTGLVVTDPLVDVRYFIPAAKILETADEVAGLSKELIPIAAGELGNFICMGAKDHKIYYWEHDLNHDGEIQGVLVASESFRAFLAGLEPFDLEAYRASIT